MSKSKKFAQDEFAKDLRQQQVSKLAFRSVAEGIGHFKEGRHEEAYQCLNKALSIDPRNVEGLVARGALNANSAHFQKAIGDFETALKLNPSHNNAKKYLGETLLALGRSLEEENKFEEAQKAYIECLNVNPHHQEALASLNYIKTKINARKIIEPAELELPPLNLGGALKDAKSSKDETRGKKAKKDKKKRVKKRRDSSSDSSSDSSESSESSTESTDNSSSSSDSDSRSKKKNKKRKSISPPKADTVDSRYGQYGTSGNFDPMDEHELKVKKFLEMSRDEDDYEEKVGQLIAEASKYQKSKQDSSKKKKKSEKKVKKEKKKRKKDDKKKGKEPDIDEIREALKMFENLPDKIKKLYQDKIKDDESKQKGNESADNNMSEEGKWKMKFSKTETDVKSKKANNFSLYDSEDEDQARNFQAHAPSQPAPLNPYASTSAMAYTKAASPKPEPPAVPLIINQGPVVLDKFGNFRRVVDPNAPVVPALTDSRRSRSKGRRSRSNSRSPRRRRSRSHRRYSHSRSRSYSRSPGRGNRGGGRRRAYSPASRGRPAYRGRFDGGKFRDSRDFRGDFRDRRMGGRGRFGGGRYDRRSFSRSPEPRRISRSPDRKDEKKDGGKW